MTDLVVRGAVLEGAGPSLRLLPRASVVVRAGRIASVGAGAGTSAVRAVDLGSDEVLAPAFVDVHAHWKMAALPASVFEPRPGDTTGARIARYDRALGTVSPAQAREAVARAAAEAAAGGTATAWTRASFDGMAEALAGRGPRLMLSRTLRDGPDLPARLEAALHMARARRDPATGLLPGLAVHEAGLPDAALRAVDEAARLHPDGPLPVQAHLSQRAEEAAELGESATERLLRTGVLDSGAFVAVHASYCSDRDLDLLAARRIPVAYCPVAARRAGAPVPLGRLRGRTPVLLATDTPPFRMGPQLAEACAAAGLSPREAFAAATSQAAAALRLPTGALVEGRLADLAVWRVGEDALAAGPDAAIRRLAGEHETRATWVGGRLVHAARDATVDRGWSAPWSG